MEQSFDRLTALSFDEQIMPFVLTVAGMDPSGGAGVLADIKAFQCQCVYGLAVITCNTNQTDEAFYQLDWLSEDMILSSISRLGARFDIRAVKIGAVRDRNMLQRIIKQIHTDLPSAAIIWDPVFKASTGNAFFRFDKDELKGRYLQDWTLILKACKVITPNVQEAVVIGQLTGICENAPIPYQLPVLDPISRQLARHAAILLKGGHWENGAAVDRLYYTLPGQKSVQVLCLEGIGGLSKKVGAGFEKHGSGCVHSSLLTAKLAKGVALGEAARSVKYAMEAFLLSCKGKLGIDPTLQQAATKRAQKN